ncbi:DUF1624 domain-containing protein [Shewanella gelidii]|uniref:Membrane protein n=1 Tax=Shewanella gelidii TaxID=1642821 RepID=A0A917JSY0_9GAMM|nr:heparan-alpha-glucosaminide N-acetyltransferase domain-containing protein [Shewanella gelidii]MCL1097639.1 heparan-alpha-glucosaminide N-acetyltransferase domain-containing protein [Shewanella gelidii]GGI79996.1 membrane protein [Shewanella gelidii]
MPDKQMDFVPTPAPSKHRIHSIDILRGLVMLLMLVDHVRERFFYHNQISDPMSLADTSTALFFTRMTAHLCAPTFVFLTGLSAWLYANPHNKPSRDAAPFLIKRGLFLIFIEIALVNLSWFGTYHVLYLQIIWTIGLCMILLGLLCRLNHWFIGAIGIALIFGNRLLDPISFAPDEVGYTLWTILHDGGYLVAEGLVKVRAGGFPVTAWFGVICLGYVLGPLYAQSVSAFQRQKVLVTCGLLALALLTILRGFNLYGEVEPWVVGANGLETLKSMINFSKYPPSANFILLNLGIATLILAAMERVNNRCSQIVENFGSAPMFFYVVHLYVLLFSYKILAFLFGENKVKDTGWHQGTYFGFDHVWQIWAAAALLAMLLYWPTKTFANYRQRTSIRWVKYF